MWIANWALKIPKTSWQMYSREMLTIFSHNIFFLALILFLSDCLLSLSDISCSPIRVIMRTYLIISDSRKTEPRMPGTTEWGTRSWGTTVTRTSTSRRTQNITLTGGYILHWGHYLQFHPLLVTIVLTTSYIDWEKLRIVDKCWLQKYLPQFFLFQGDYDAKSVSKEHKFVKQFRVCGCWHPRGSSSTQVRNQ